MILGKIQGQKLDHLNFAAANKKRRALNRAKEEGLLNSPEEGKRAALRIPEEVVESIIS